MRVDLEMLDDQIFTKLVDYVTNNLTEPILTEDNFSTVENDLADNSIFPFVFLKRIGGTETALDLERNTFNGGLFTYEIRVTSNESQEEAKDVMNCITKAMKSMLFSGTSLPISSDSDNLHMVSARWQRELHEDDSL